MADGGGGRRPRDFRTIVADAQEYAKEFGEVAKEVTTTLAWEARFGFGRRTARALRRPARALGVLALLAVGVAVLFLLLNGYINPTEPRERKDLILALAQILGGTALLSGLYLTWRTLQVNREGQITERFTRAIDQLGKTDDMGKKLFEIRLGGIYALERIARESEEDYWPVMEILTAYVRQHARRLPERVQKATEDAAEEKHVLEDSGGESEATEVPKPDPDIQAIITVLRRRNRRYGYDRFDMHGEPAPLNLAVTNLSEVNLGRANLREANLYKADLSGAWLFGADLKEANLSAADLRGADLRGASLHSMEGISEALLPAADLSGADLSTARLSQKQLNQARGDENTRLPPDLDLPARWDVKIDEQREEH